jgi:hypothetical protein
MNIGIRHSNLRYVYISYNHIVQNFYFEVISTDSRFAMLDLLIVK